MTYPILPLTPTWGNTENEQTDIAKTKYGDAGVEQRDFIGINPLSTSWELNVNIINFQEVDEFLKARRGRPFRLSLDGGLTDDGKLYYCMEWQIQQPGIGVANFSAKLNQVQRLLFITPITPPVIPPPEIISPIFQLSGNGANNATNFREFYGNKLKKNGGMIYSIAQHKWNGSSIYFDGNSYLEASNYSNLNLNSAENFTIETWVYLISTGTVRAICSNINNAFSKGFAFLIHSDDKLRFQSDGAIPDIYSSLTVASNQWSHIAISKLGNNYIFAVNGETETIIDATTWESSESSSFRIGRTPRNDYPYPFEGYLDDILISKNARYTSNFDISTQEFSRPEDNVQNKNILLLDFTENNSNNDFYDYYGNSISGNAQISTNSSKFFGSSAYFNNSYIKSQINPDFDIFSSDFTIELWVYLNRVDKYPHFITIGNNRFNRATLYLLDARINFFMYVGFNYSNFITGSQLNASTWYHLCLTKEASVFTLFLDGVIQGTSNTDIYPIGDLEVSLGYMIYGNLAADYLDGYIDSVRITKGIARYKEDFTPDNFPFILQRDVNLDKVAFLSHFNGINNSTNLFDLTNKTITTYGNPVISTVNSKWNGSSLYLNGINAALLIPTSELDLRSSANPVWTIECWICQLSQIGRRVIFTNYNLANGAQSNTLLLCNNQIGTDHVWFNYNLPQNEWVHWSVVRDGNNEINLYINGIFINKISANPEKSSSYNYIGGSPNDNNLGNDWLNAYINDFRITLIARYTTNFTPPTKPFPEIN